MRAALATNVVKPRPRTMAKPSIVIFDSTGRQRPDPTPEPSGHLASHVK